MAPSNACSSQPWLPQCRPECPLPQFEGFWRDYVKRHEAAQLDANAAKYLVIHIGGGFGNQLNGMVPLLFAGMLAGAVVVHHQAVGCKANEAGASCDTKALFHMENYFDAPFFQQSAAIKEAIRR